MTGQPTVEGARAVPAAEPEPGWQRLDGRTIPVRMVNEVIGFIPVLIGVIALGQHDSSRFWWGLAVIGLLLARGVLHWATTRYRVTEEQLEVRTGLFNRQRLTARRDRVRTVESTARFGHRLFGVTAVHIGTGQHDQRRRPLRLDAVSVAEADRLRHDLLRRQATSTGPIEPTADTGQRESGALIASLRPAWLAYAPLTLSGLASIGVLLALVWRSANELDINPANVPGLRSGVHWVEHASVGGLIAVGTVIVLLVVVVGSVVVYVFQFAGYRLTREPDATLHVRRGLLTRSMVTIEEARLRGVAVREPLLLRAARGGRCTAVATGLRGGRSESHLLMPPGPAAQAHRVAGEVLRSDPSPTATPLVRHLPAALRRRLTRAVVPVLALTLVLWLSALAGGPGWTWIAALALVPVAAAIGYDRYRGLGHALTDGYLVTRSGSLDRRTVALQRTGIIGWQLRQSFFQRRLGLVTLTATTAAGHGAYHVLDLAEPAALELAEAAQPGLLAPFTH
ncbi:MAG TPA: PH domain-containing protein [Pseudonocardiaceae bacterium]|nr:PH domain-containing protein [Pseudonocardiaceae bacterium]